MRCALVMAVVMVGCGGGTSTSSTTQVIPERALTVGDALLTSLPAGAEILVELDLARLRANPIIGGIATDLLAAPPAIAGAPEAPIDGATAVALAAYRVGTPAATTITVVAESGIFTAQDVERLEKANIDAILVGEALVTSEDIPAKVREFVGTGLAPVQPTAPVRPAQRSENQDDREGHPYKS